MKKLMILAGAAVLALVACNKSETVVKETNPGEMTFKAMTSNVTKGAELTGTLLKSNYGIYAAATQKNASGIIENPSFFASPYEHLFGTTVQNPVAATPWKAGTFTSGDVNADPWDNGFDAVPVYWPLGGVKMDFLAYAMPMASHEGVVAGDWLAVWNNAATDVASKVTFVDVDTYLNQEDVLYAVANNRTSANSGASDYVPMTFNHAQALLIFNVKVNDVADNKIQISEIEFITPARVAALQAGVAAHSPLTDSGLLDADATLKTVGTFTVDNSRNTLQAGWTYGASAIKKENYKMPAGAAGNKSGSNLAAVIDAKQLYAADIPYNTNYAQLGETLLIPEQEKVNFTIKYTLGGNTYYYTYNDLRGVWEKGKKYIYNIDMALQEIIITENVVDFVDELTHPGDGTGTGEVPLS